MKRPSYAATLGESYASKQRALRVAYMAGPGDVTAVMRLLAAGQRDLTNSHVGYSELMVRACQEAGVASLLMLSTHPEAPSSPERVQVGALDVKVMRMPDHYEGKRRLGFHAASFQQAAYLRDIVEGFRADVLVVGDDPPRAVALKAVKRTGCKVIRVHHCAITPIKQPRSFGKRLLLGLDTLVADGVFDAVLSASRQVSDQARELWGSTPVVEFLPHFDEALHKRVSPLPPLQKWVSIDQPFHASEVFQSGDLPPIAGNSVSYEVTKRSAGTLHLEGTTGPELRCVFVGRIEREKGVFDLLEAAKLCWEAGARVSFDLCGYGSAFDELRDAVIEAIALGTVPPSSFRLHGRCNREQMQAIIAQAHLGVVPTRSEFVEGFAQTVCEFLLGSRPVLATKAVPGASYAAGSVAIVNEDDSQSLANELVYFASDRGFAQLQRMAENCEGDADKFLRPDTSFQAAIGSVLQAIARGERPSNRSIGFKGEISQ